ncbi:MAG: hypothetical protein AAGA10_19765, partial [Bacteroidota bacterium]
MKKHILLLVFLTSIGVGVPLLNGQSVGINNPSPDPSAILDITTTEKGVLIPRLTLAQRDAIPNPAQGLLVFISSDTSFHYYTGTQWESLSAPILQVTGGVAYTAGVGIEINGDQIINLGDADPNDDVQINSSAEGDLGGVFPDP